MSDLILDTNAYRYLFDIKNGGNPTINVNGKLISNDKFVEFCGKCENLYITGETLFELFWQSIEKDNAVDDFVNKYSFMKRFKQEYGVPIKVLNNIDRFFDMEKFAKEYNMGRVDCGYYIKKKKEYEVDTLTNLIFIMYGALLLSVVEYCQIDIDATFYCEKRDYIKNQLSDIADKYYIQRSIIKNEIYDQEIDKMLFQMWKSTMNIFSHASSNWGIEIPNIRSSVDGGIKYMQLLYNKLKKDNNTFMKRFEDNLNDLCCQLIDKRNYHIQSIEFIKYICRGCVYSGSKLRKNDGIDYLIITCLAVDDLINETKEALEENDTYMLTFDRKLNEFSKKGNVLYNKNIYDSLLN